MASGVPYKASGPLSKFLPRAGRLSIGKGAAMPEHKTSRYPYITQRIQIPTPYSPDAPAWGRAVLDADGWALWIPEGYPAGAYCFMDLRPELVRPWPADAG